MKTLKIKESTHKVLKWIQSQDYLRNLPKNELDIDSIIYKSLINYAVNNRYSLDAIREIIESEAEYEENTNR